MKGTSSQPAPPGFKKMESSAASGGVMGMMQKIIDDAKALEAEAIHAEESAQSSYEEFVTETNESIDAKNKDITNKSDAKAKDEGEKVQAETEKEVVMGEIQELQNQNADLHKSCDWILKNFDIRQG